MTETIEEKLSTIVGMLRQQATLQKEIQNLHEACEYLDVSPSYMYKLTCTNAIPHYCPTGKKLYFRRSELDAWVLQHKQASSGEIEQQAKEYLLKNKRR
jgi:excisionase family DNA binding protein